MEVVCAIAFGLIELSIYFQELKENYQTMFDITIFFFLFFLCVFVNILGRLIKSCYVGWL